MNRGSIVWEDTFITPPEFVQALAAFMADPDSRTCDIFTEKSFAVAPDLALHWVVKHDLFEGTIMHLSLMDTEAYRYLAGLDRPLQQPEDLYGDYDVLWSRQAYRLHIRS